MWRALQVLVLLALVLGAGAWVATIPRSVDAADLAGMEGDATRGEAVFWAAGCASCHAADDADGEARLVLSGGQGFASDFGTFYAPNISMDPENGIGDWSLAEFVTAVQNGVSPEGRHYYPAFPYTAYGLAETADIVDLWAFWQTLPASEVESPAHEVGFPFNIRRAVGAWNILYRPRDFVVEAEGLTEQQLRGRYLSEALAHCGECHTPRDALGGPIRDAWLAGAPNPTGDGTIPDITPAALTWSEAEIAAYLNDGFTPDFDSAGGHMRGVILNLANLPEADRAAIAAYLQAVPAAE